MKGWWGVPIGALAALVIAVSLWFGFDTLFSKSQANCKGVNDIKQLVHDLEKDTAPLQKVHRPGETDDQYKFRQDQNRQTKRLIEKRLVKLEC